jgi:hypothetical protein
VKVPGYGPDAVPVTVYETTAFQRTRSYARGLWVGGLRLGQALAVERR